MSIDKLISKEFWTVDRLAESVAVISSFLYTFLYIKVSPWCWLFALVGAIIFTYLCYAKRILAESFLQFFYVVMAIYGYLTMNTEWQMTSWNWQTHMALIGLGVIGMMLSYFGLKKYTAAKMPLEDSFTTIFSLIATWIMVNYVHENYLYWIVIDAVSVHLYWKREMYFGSLLFAAYSLMVTAGYFGWM
jgi:nicotinamide mononucleotide transporter